MFKNKIDNPHNTGDNDLKNSKKKDEKYQPSLALVKLNKNLRAMKNGGGKCL